MKRKRFRKFMALVLAFVLLQNNMVVYASEDTGADENVNEVQEVAQEVSKDEAQPAKLEESPKKSEEPVKQPETEPEEPVKQQEIETEEPVKQPETEPEEPVKQPETEPEEQVEQPETEPEESLEQPETESEESEEKLEKSEEKLEESEEDASSQEEKWIVSFEENASLHGEIYVEGEAIDVVSYRKEMNAPEDFSFTIEVLEEYEVDAVRADGLEIAKAEETSVYTLVSVEKDTVISVTYKEIEEEVPEQQEFFMIAEQKAPVMKSINTGEEKGKEIRNIGRNESYDDKETLQYLSWDGDPINNTIKFVDANSDGKVDSSERLAYCVNYDKSFVDDHDYNAAAWIDVDSEYKKAYEKLYSELAYVVSIGAQTYGNNASEKHSTGNWMEDYYITQEVIYMVIDDWVNGNNDVFGGLGLSDAQITALKDQLDDLFSGHGSDKLSVNESDSWYTDEVGDRVLNGVNDMYEAVKDYRADRAEAGDSDGYDATILIPKKPSSFIYNAQTDCYEIEFSVRTTGKIKGQIQVECNHPNAAISSTMAGMYRISIPAGSVTQDSQINISAFAFFERIKTNVYLAKDGKQSVLFYSDEKANATKISTGFSAKLNVEETELEVYKKDTMTGASIKGVTFEVYTSESCGTDTLIGRITTNEKGYAELGGINIKYKTLWLKETVASEGYILDSAPIKVDLSGSGFNATVKNNKNTLTISKQDITGEGKELPGAVLQVVDKSTGLVAKTIDNVELSWITGETAVTFEGLRDGEYILREVEAPAGYTLAEKIEFTVENGHIYHAGNQVEALIMFDRQTEIAFAKVDEAGNYLAGAVLAVYRVNEDDTLGELVERWTTIDDIHMILGMEVGNYRLVEESAPSGYATAWAIDFEVDSILREEPVVIEMLNCHTKVQITKQFEVVDGKEYHLKTGEEVVFEILTVDGEEIMAHASITDENPVALIEGLPVGDYILREVKAPEGFTLAADVVFTITDEMADAETVKMHEVSVTNTAATLEVHKVDGDNLELLKGAKLQILEKATGLVATTVYGEKLEWITDGNVKVVKGLAAGEYILHEAEAPEGYELAEDINFIVTDSSENNIVLMKDMKIVIVEEKDDDKAVKTGDETPFAMWTLLMMTSLICMIAIVRKRYK